MLRLAILPSSFSSLTLQLQDAFTETLHVDLKLGEHVLHCTLVNSLLAKSSRTSFEMQLLALVGCASGPVNKILRVGCHSRIQHVQPIKQPRLWHMCKVMMQCIVLHCWLSGHNLCTLSA